MLQKTKTAVPVAVGSSQYLLLMVAFPSLAFISWHECAGSSGMEPSGAWIKRKEKRERKRKRKVENNIADLPVILWFLLLSDYGSIGWKFPAEILYSVKQITCQLKTGETLSFHRLTISRRSEWLLSGNRYLENLRGKIQAKFGRSLRFFSKGEKKAFKVVEE